MNLKLQNRHRYIWTIIAVVLPILFIAAYTVIPDSAAYQNPKKTKTERANTSNYIITPLLDNELMKVQYLDEKMIGDTILPYQVLELFLKQPLTNPSNVVYLSKDKTIENGIALGNLNNTTKYKFKVNRSKSKSMPYLILYDALHSSIISTTQLPIGQQ